MDIERYTNRVKGLIKPRRALRFVKGTSSSRRGMYSKCCSTTTRALRPAFNRSGGRHKDALAAVEKALAKRLR